MANLPQRKPNRTMTGKQLLEKAMTGSHIRKTEKEIKEKQLQEIISR